ncbi:MAG: hypothetical protein KJ822_17880 [Proteobacteria bacterium]|nr:hypothetical protein [Pseudomonadota bacterium]
MSRIILCPQNTSWWWRIEEAILELLLMDEPGSAIDPIGATRQIFSNPADNPTERSITGRFG